MTRVSSGTMVAFMGALALVTTPSCTDNTSSSSDWGDEEQEGTPEEREMWTMEDHIKHYEQTLGKPEDMEVLENKKGEKYLLLEYPTDEQNPDGTKKTVKFYKELDGKKSISADSVKESDYRHSGSHVMFYRYYPYYTGSNFNAASPYHGYYTAPNQPIQTPSERAYHHSHNIKSQTGIAKMTPAATQNFATFKASGFGSHSTMGVNSHGTGRGGFGRTGGFHSSGGFHAGG